MRTSIWLRNCWTPGRGKTGDKPLLSHPNCWLGRLIRIIYNETPNNTKYHTINQYIYIIFGNIKCMVSRETHMSPSELR